MSCLKSSFRLSKKISFIKNAWSSFAFMETPENIQINMYAVKFQPRRRQIVVEQGVAKHFDPRA